MISKVVEFKNESGDKLSGKLILPVDQEPHNYALFAHCFTCSKNLNAVKSISNALVNYGFGVLSFDFTGLGNSKGNFSESNFSSNIRDLQSAAAYLKANFKSPSLIVGHSLGGAASIHAASEIESIQAIATIGAPSEPQHVQHLFKNNLKDLEETGQAEVNIGGRPFLIKKQLVDDLKQHSLSDVLKEMRKSILILHSPQDTIVDIENAANIYQFAHHPKSFVSLDGADHLLSNIHDAVYAGEVIGAWANRYVDKPRNLSKNKDQEVDVRMGGGENKFTVNILAGNHHLMADEPEDVGGDDLGPSPYQLLSSALGACTAMTLKMYADRKGWKIDELFIKLDHDKIHFDDCESCEKGKSKIDRFKRQITIKGDLNPDQIKRLLEIADKCPVHKTLLGKIEIVTELVP